MYVYIKKSSDSIGAFFYMLCVTGMSSIMRAWYCPLSERPSATSTALRSGMVLMDEDGTERLIFIAHCDAFLS